MSLEEKKEISASGKMDVPSVGSLSGTVKTDELGNVSVSAEAKANVYGACRVGGHLEVDGDKNVSGGGNVGIDFNPIAAADFHINVDKYGKFYTGVNAKLNFGILIIGGHAGIDQNGQTSARVDIQSSKASIGNIGCNVEIDKNGEMSGGVRVEKNLDKIDVAIEKKSGKTNFSRSTNPVNEGPGQLTGERSGDFGGSIKIGDTNYQLDFSQPKYWSHLGQNTKLGNLGPGLWTYGRSGDVGCIRKSLNLSNFWTHGRSEDVVSSVDKIGDTNNQTDLMDKLMQIMDVNLGTEHLTYGRRDDVGSSVDKIGDTNNQTDLMDKLMQTMDVNLGTEHLTYGRRDDVGSSGYNFGDTNHKSDLLDTFMRARDDKFSRPIFLSNLDQNTKPVNVGTEHLTYGRSDEVGSSTSRLKASEGFDYYYHKTDFMVNLGPKHWTQKYFKDLDQEVRSRCLRRNLDG